MQTPAPTIQGLYGKAWLTDIASHRIAYGVPQDQDATVVSWIIEAQWAHPLWSHYSIILVHLRPMEDQRKTLLYLDNPTHELWVHALTPGVSIDDLLKDGPANAFLTPTNFSAQIEEPTDEAASERVQKAVQLICDGLLSPDIDFIQQWVALFGDNMLKDRQNRKPPKVRVG